MRTRRQTGCADQSDHFTLPDAFASMHGNPRQVGVPRGQPIGVLELDKVAIAIVPAGGGNRCVCHRHHRRARRSAEVDRKVSANASKNRMKAGARKT